MQWLAAAPPSPSLVPRDLSAYYQVICVTCLRFSTHSSLRYLLPPRRKGLWRPLSSFPADAALMTALYCGLPIIRLQACTSILGNGAPLKFHNSINYEKSHILSFWPLLESLQIKLNYNYTSLVIC